MAWQIDYQNWVQSYVAYEWKLHDIKNSPISSITYYWLTLMMPQWLFAFDSPTDQFNVNATTTKILAIFALARTKEASAPTILVISDGADNGSCGLTWNKLLSTFLISSFHFFGLNQKVFFACHKGFFSWIKFIRIIPFSWGTPPPVCLLLAFASS